MSKNPLLNIPKELKCGTKEWKREYMRQRRALNINNEEVRSKIKHNGILKEKRKQLKVKAIEFKGGKCSVCNGVFHWASYDFHHLDPKDKDFNIASIAHKDWALVVKELDKCILICSNCHRQLHATI